MTAADSSVLGKKVRRSNLDLSAYPQLEDLTRYFSAAVARTLMEAARATVELANAQASISDFDAAVSSLAQHSALYESHTFQDEEPVLFGLAPEFAAALAESLLGGDFSLEGKQATSSPMEARLAQPFVEDLSRKLNAYMGDVRSTVGKKPLQTPQLVGCGDNAKKNDRYGLFFGVTAGMRLETGNTVGIVSALFPVTFLETAGFLDQQRKPLEQAQSGGRWRETMESTVNGLEVPLTIVLARRATRLSDLSRIKIGDIIPLDDNAHNDLDVVLHTRNGAVSIGKAKLGAYKQHKAVKLVTDLAVCNV